jgi:hypothetical protein
MRTSRPLAALVAASAATVLVTGLTSTPASAAVLDSRPVRIGATWLPGELTDGLVHNEQFAGFIDYGLSIDFALGLDAVDKKPQVVQDIADAVGDDVTSYTTFGESVFAGQIGKAAVLALVAGRDPRAFGGQDLITQLEGRVSASAPITGRIEDDSTFGDAANVVGQSHAARALSLAGSTKAADATEFLLQQQCGRGYFRQYFTADKTSSDQSCDGAPVAERQPSTDATALAVLALQDIDSIEVREAVGAAVMWLIDRQAPNGSFTDNGKVTGIANANSTGLAAWAMASAAQLRPARKAATWVRNLQVPTTNPCAGKLRRQVGAVAYDAAAYRRAQRKGIQPTKSDQWRRTSAQALPALVWAPAADGRFTASAPAKVGSGDRLRIRITGAAPGERVCVTGGGVREFLGKRQALAQVAFKAPTRTGPRTFTVWLGSRARQVSVRVTG